VRNLLDRFDGDVDKAVGAYNGGPRNPNPHYAAGVGAVAAYARNILERVTAANEQAATDTLELGIDTSQE
jgi:soluble lytic murein transglycosylase-like protein